MFVDAGEEGVWEAELQVERMEIGKEGGSVIGIDDGDGLAGTIADDRSEEDLVEAISGADLGGGESDGSAEERGYCGGVGAEEIGMEEAWGGVGEEEPGFEFLEEWGVAEGCGTPGAAGLAGRAGAGGGGGGGHGVSFGVGGRGSGEPAGAEVTAGGRAGESAAKGGTKRRGTFLTKSVGRRVPGRGVFLWRMPVTNWDKSGYVRVKSSGQRSSYGVAGGGDFLRG
jgi:hypothetical protein